MERVFYQILSDGQSAPVFPVMAPQDEDRPYITYQTISSAPLNTLGGTSSGGDFEATVQVNIVCDSFLEAQERAAEVRSSLHGTRSLTSSPRLNMIHLTSEMTDEAAPAGGGERPIYRVLQDYQVEFND